MQRNSVNKVLLVGRTGSDAEVRYTTKGMAIATISMATTETHKDGKGEFQDNTEWHRVVVFGKIAEFTENYVKKGALIYVEGRLQTRSWDDKEEKRHYMTEVVGDKLTMLGGWKKGAEENATAAVAEAEEEVPF
ncbi:MAG: single-stranded DNA-binding protein [Candidatus Marinimicrobia bacterium]|nr:single-stranded DNA-binding protein [Candidatus Neomarinimicrobiota bacterium]MCF7922808.1 single-stranded DNA-binding protein [Candidatus Neomarinimicrobiota bacterium]